MIRAGAKLGPRLYSTGTILYGAESPFKAAIENYDDAVSHLRRLKAAGAWSVKSYNQQRRDVASDDSQGGARAADERRARGRIAPLS